MVANLGLRTNELLYEEIGNIIAEIVLYVQEVVTPYIVSYYIRLVTTICPGSKYPILYSKLLYKMEYLLPGHIVLLGHI